MSFLSGKTQSSELTNDHHYNDTNEPTTSDKVLVSLDPPDDRLGDVRDIGHSIKKKKKNRLIIFM